jgi:hypothetical protein
MSSIDEMNKIFNILIVDGIPPNVTLVRKINQNDG